MILSKTVDGRLVEVYFVANAPPHEASDEEKEKKEKEGYQVDTSVNFTVFITNLNGDKRLCIEATSEETEIYFNSVLITNDLEK